MIRVAIDTSVLISAVISPTGPNAQLFDFIIAKEIRPYLTDAVLEEYDRVLSMSAFSIWISGGLLSYATCWNVLASKSGLVAASQFQATKTTTASTNAPLLPKPTISSPKTAGIFQNPTNTPRS